MDADLLDEKRRMPDAEETADPMKIAEQARIDTVRLGQFRIQTALA